jgi:flagellar biosynthesis GTPase FlhF
MSFSDFVNYNTIINQGTTGTGKTTIVAEKMFEYKNKKKNIKFLSIIDIRKLGEQQIKTFNDKKLNLINYQDLNDSDDFKKEDMTVCCINSLHKFVDNIDIKNYIVYIDEINSFINNYIFNNTLNKTLQKTTKILMNIIKN